MFIKVSVLRADKCLPDVFGNLADGHASVFAEQVDFGDLVPVAVKNFGTFLCRLKFIRF